MATLPIALETLSVPKVYGPAQVPPGTTAFEIQILRNVGASPFRGFAAGVGVLRVVVEYSADGGSSWVGFGGKVEATWLGGILTDRRTSLEIGQNVLGDSSVPQGGNVFARCTATPLAGPVSLSGQLVVT